MKELVDDDPVYKKAWVYAETPLRLNGNYTLQDAVRATDDQFRRLVESVTEYAIFLLDTSGNILTWNTGAERIKGYTADEIIGKHFSVFYTAEDIARAHPAEELIAALEDGRFEEEGWRLRKDRTRFLANVVISPMYDSQGVHCGFSKVTRDITDRKMAEEDRMRKMRDDISRVFLRDIIFSVTEGRLRFCDTQASLPAKFSTASAMEPFERGTLAFVRHKVEETVRAIGFSDERIFDFLTAVGEASMNAVVHARRAQFQIFTESPGTIQVWITDEGTGIDLKHIHRATLERGFTTGGSLGHGFWLILRTCDRVWLYSTSEGTTIVLEQDGTTPDPQWLSSSKSDPSFASV